MDVVLFNDQYHSLVNIIKQSESPAEFEQHWTEVMETTELGNNEWLSSMYEIRSRWVPSYVKHVFATGMTSSQRSESGHSFLKKYVDKKNSLTDFITRFNRALAHQRHAELVANHIDINEKPRVFSAFMMENQMLQIYTKKIFLLFQKEIEQSHFYTCSKRTSLDDVKVYTVQRFEPGNSFDRQRQVTYCTSSDCISCSCRMFDFDGYPCRHMICYMKIKQVMLLPDKYILRRWTNHAKQAPVFDQTTGLSVDNSSGHSLMSRHGMLAHAASELVDDASLTDARSTFLLGEFQCLRIRVKDIDSGGDIGMSRNKTREEIQVIRDPNPVKAKGCGKRLKSGKEKALSQSSRQCRACGNSGHDKKTCPTLQNRLDNTLPLQYPHNAPDPHYSYDAPNPQYSYDMSDDRFTSIDNSNYDAAVGFFSNQYPFP
ncbi:Protein FAR1-RELATED SEQUENCE 5 [Abeliophyllum distichum]|uniref:Protein FAR1-RELATED SEQUENCE n=1 Tax=Abeliophyllum distichum TaxID=126358 RepID=A0ABD1Q3G7_9LAMI